MNTPVSVAFDFDLETEDGVSLTGVGSLDGNLEYDRGDYYNPPYTDISPDLGTCWFKAIWMDEDENEVEIDMEGREAYDFLEAYGWSYDKLELSDWDEIEYEPDYEDYYED